MDMATSSIALVDYGIKLTKAIIQAREEMKSAPKILEDLIKQVLRANELLVRLESANEATRNNMKSVILDLNKELEAVQAWIGIYSAKVRQTLKEGMKSFLGQGAAKQNRTAEALTRRIMTLVDNLHRQVSVETLIIVGKSSSSGWTCPQKPELVKVLDDLTDKTLEEEVCKVVLDGNYNTATLDKLKDSGVDDDEPGRRAAREGGYEIDDYTKIKFKIKVEEDFWFYLVTYDNITGERPELFHPNYSSANHSLKSDYVRTFPDQAAYIRDPRSFLIQRSEPGPVGYQIQTVYFIFSPEKLHEDGPAKKLTIEHIQEKIEEEATNEESEIIVKRFIFDIKP